MGLSASRAECQGGGCPRFERGQASLRVQRARYREMQAGDRTRSTASCWKRAL